MTEPAPDVIRMRGEPIAALLEASHDGLLLLDASHRVTFANAAALTFLGVRSIIGRRFDELVSGAARKPVRELLARGTGEGDAVLAGRRVRLELRADGGWTTVRVAEPGDAAAKPSNELLRRFLLRFPYGVLTVRRTGTVSFANPLAKRLVRPADLRAGRPLPDAWPLAASVRDLVERARSAQTPASLLAELEGQTLRVVAVSGMIEDDAVVIVEDVTREHQHDRIYGEFVRNAAHQMRTPATAIASTIEILQGGAKEIPEQRDRFLDHIERESGRLVRLIKAMLVLARAQAGVEPPRLEFVPLRPLLEQATESATDGQTEIDVSCDPAIAVLVERDLVEQAFQAVLENAVRHSGDRVRVHASESEAGRVTLHILDSGRGIAPDALQHVQEPFFRASSDTNGFGLGLAIAAQAVTAVGGAMAIDSTPGQGTRVTIDLPSGRIRETA